MPLPWHLSQAQKQKREEKERAEKEQQEQANESKGNKFFFSGKINQVRKNPEGGNVEQCWVMPSPALSGPFEQDAIPLVQTRDPYGSRSYNINGLLLEGIRMTDAFWDLAKYTTFREVIVEIQEHCTYLTPWEPGTHDGRGASGMQSHMRGVSTAGNPGAAYTILLKLFILRLTSPQVTRSRAPSRAPRAPRRHPLRPRGAPSLCRR